MRSQLLSKRPTINRRQVSLISFGLAVVGAIIIVTARAAGPLVAFEAEKSILTSGATTGVDSAASGGSYVQLGEPAAPGTTDPVIAAAGDIACDPTSASFNAGNGSATACHQKSTSDIIASNPAIMAVLTLGDNQYECGGLTAYQKAYDPAWGRFKSITHPVPGNHEYISRGAGCDATGKAGGYFGYFGSSAGQSGQGYYSYNVGAWHLIALNSDCSAAGGCGTTSPQYKWLQSDLAAHANKCTLAYFHHPVFSQDTSGGRANAVGQPFWQLLYNANAELVINGHSHNYERYPALTPAGKADAARGVVQIIAGTGGANHTSIDTTLMPKPLVTNTQTFGVLELTLHAASYTWQFVPEAGGTFTDSGTGNCH